MSTARKDMTYGFQVLTAETWEIGNEGLCNVARGGRRATVVKKMGSWTTGKRQKRVGRQAEKDSSLTKVRVCTLHLCSNTYITVPEKMCLF
jgi:hypothetical protein